MHRSGTLVHAGLQAIGQVFISTLYALIRPVRCTRRARRGGRGLSAEKPRQRTRGAIACLRRSLLTTAYDDGRCTQSAEARRGCRSASTAVLAVCRCSSSAARRTADPLDDDTGISSRTRRARTAQRPRRQPRLGRKRTLRRWFSQSTLHPHSLFPTPSDPDYDTPRRPFTPAKSPAIRS